MFSGVIGKVICFGVSWVFDDYDLYRAYVWFYEYYC